ncbi:OLC1v1036727C1 [Oldenlandia corymbosa var. corymbosa]|uniref:Glycosyltransferase n=1 Tax=Oldenlandia corymbosa var. corymbosa TaxID=529605 RepID=A0AAV1CWR6_OLDCO|nr:OLC1v1036727C1 [Oldenlandia corymbosa var. corymbosa]
MSSNTNYTSQNFAQNGGAIGTTSSCRVAVVMIPYPDHGHLNQLLHLSRLISSYNIPVHFVSIPVAPAWKSVHSNVHFHDICIPFPVSRTKFISPKIPSFEAMVSVVSLHCEPIITLVEKLSNATERIIVIHDSLMFNVAKMVLATCSTLLTKQDIYSFTASSAFDYYANRQLFNGKPILIDGEPAKIFPSVRKTVPVPGFDFKKFLEESYAFNHKNVLNTSRLIEGGFIDLMAKKIDANESDEENEKWAIGPWIPSQILLTGEGNTIARNRDKCLEWLEKQSQNSVLFVCFGTTSTLSAEQIKEIAVGLEISGYSFIWVIPEPEDGDAKDGAVPPQDFEEIVHQRGMIVRDWAPQLEILCHSSTGGFVSHCGWNSCMESISMGVPMAAWPMQTDQPMNAFLITQVLKVGLMVRDWENGYGLVKSSAIAKAVRRLMGSDEGNKIRRRAKELSDAVKGSIKGNGATEEMDRFIAHITR